MVCVLFALSNIKNVENIYLGKTMSLLSFSKKQELEYFFIIDTLNIELSHTFGSWREFGCCDDANA